MHVGNCGRLGYKGGGGHCVLNIADGWVATGVGWGYCMLKTAGGWVAKEVGALHLINCGRLGCKSGGGIAS